MQSNEINVYDFDGTIYDGDSSLDFFLYCLKNNKKNILLLPKIFFFFILYLFNIIKKEKFKSVFFSFMKNLDDKKSIINDFWSKYEKKINLSMKKILLLDNKAVIVSASPAFLIEPIAKKLNVKKVLASNVDIKSGEWLNENCSGKNKIKFLDNKFKNYIIDNSYSNSYDDHFVADSSKNAYLVKNGCISSYDTKELELKKLGKEGLVLAILFTIIYFILGMIINYNYDTTNNYNFLFDSDTNRVFNDFTNIFGNHYRISVHPLILLFEPIIFFIKGISQNSVVAVVLFTAIVGALSIKYLYKTIGIFNKNKLVRTIITLIYGFSFSSLIFYTTIENYALSSFFFILLWYYVSRDMYLDIKVSIMKYIAIGTISTGIILTNISVFIVGLIVLLISKKISFKKFIIINLCVVMSVICLSLFQNKVWKNAPTIFESFSSESKSRETKYLDLKLNKKKVETEINDVYMNGLISKRLHVHSNTKKVKYDYRNFVLKFNDGYNYKDIVFIVFYLIIIVSVLKNIKTKNVNLLNLGLIVSLVGMSALHLVYGNDCSFLYSQNFMYIIAILLGINYRKNNKFVNLFLCLFLVYETLKNMIVYRSIIRYINKYFKAAKIRKYISLKKECLMLLLIIISVIIICYLFAYCIKKLVLKRKSKYLVFTLILLTFLSCVFINLETITLRKNKKVETKEKKIGYNIEFENLYPDEIEEYKKYNKQYNSILKKYNAKTENIFNSKKFYLFGMANREKYVYSNGVIRKVDGEGIYKEFDIESELIIPNLYTVLIKTKNGNFYKIVEDEKSVRIIDENDEEYDVLPGTREKLSLPKYEGEKFSEVLKVLYQEIVFNIKDGVMYPNIFVYDNVWYRDIAYGAMVLEDAGNIDLIKDWILSIEDIYDKSNGEDENDNIGEILYLLSLVSDKNNKQVKKILSHVDKIVIKDDKGIYISNNTDSGLKPSYQTEWLIFGLNKLGIDNNYSYKDIDSYTNILWFTDYKTKYKNNELKNTSYMKDYPYLSYGRRHMLNDDLEIPISGQLYPLSWEMNAKKANYKKLHVINDYYVDKKISPTHVWSAAELYFLLKDDN